MRSSVELVASLRREKPSPISEKSSEFSEAMRLVKLAAEPRHVGDSVKAAIRRAARILGWTEGRTSDVWYGEACRIDSREMDALRAVERKQNIRTIEGDYRKHIEQLSALRARLQSRDADFHRADIEAISFLLNELQSAIR